MAAQPEPDRTTMSVEEYLAREETSEVKHEYVDGHVYAMSGGTLAHDLIANNIRSTLDAYLGDGPCTIFGPDVLVRVSSTVSYYPDALVLCDDNPDLKSREVSTPRLIVEVLSESTEANDRGGKWANYQTLATFEEYLLVESRSRVVERFRRSERALWTYQLYAPDATVTLETIGLTIPIATFYRRTNL